MPINSEYIEQLVFKINTGTISPAEMLVLTEWYNSHNDESVLIHTKAPDTRETVRLRMLAGLLAKVADQQPTALKRYSGMRWMVAAAAAVIFMSLGIWMVWKNKTPPPLVVATASKTIIQPGGNKASLTLADGSTIPLSNAQSGIIVSDKITYVNGTPVTNTLGSTAENQFFTIRTPRGGTYSIILNDGTQVWLNAASTLKYPAHFSADERLVEIDGEAYFKVKPVTDQKGKKIPFKVTSKRQLIEVLGTEFNITDYPEQKSSRTTLVEGKVAISDHQHHFILAPNEQALTTAENTTVSQVHASNYTAWRQNKFVFDGKTFEETMSEIGRWYDLDISYENGIPKTELIGDAFRDQNINFVLRLLDVAEIKYKLDVSLRKIIIKRKNSQL